MGKTKRRQKVKVNLVEIIRQAAPQVWGSDEREILYDWLSRNTETQVVETTLEVVRSERNQPARHKTVKGGKPH